MKKRGTFIVLEGNDGAGKDMQVELLEHDFKERDNVIFTRDPGGTDTAHAIRELVLTDYKESIVPRAELLLFLSARAQLVDELIAPALSSGTHVICQRFELSTLAYQFYGREQFSHRKIFDRLHTFVTNNLNPDLYIFLDVDPEIGMKRTEKGKGSRRDRFEKEGIDFHRRVSDAYRTEIVKHPHVIIDANRSIEDVYKNVKASVEMALSKDR